jgi:hypothetical protein
MLKNLLFITGIALTANIAFASGQNCVTIGEDQQMAVQTAKMKLIERMTEKQEAQSIGGHERIDSLDHETTIVKSTASAIPPITFDKRHTSAGSLLCATRGSV